MNEPTPANVTPIRGTQRKPKASRYPNRDIDKIENARNGLSLVIDWVIYQAESGTADDGAACAVMDLLYDARDVLKRMGNAPAGGAA